MTRTMTEASTSRTELPVERPLNRTEKNRITNAKTPNWSVNPKSSKCHHRLDDYASQMRSELDASRLKETQPMQSTWQHNMPMWLIRNENVARKLRI